MVLFYNLVLRLVTSDLVRSYKMDKITIFFDEESKQEYAIFEHADGSQTSMLKSIYDEMIKAQDEATVI
jgi:hypothetical protein